MRDLGRFRNRPLVETINCGGKAGDIPRPSIVTLARMWGTTRPRINIEKRGFPAPSTDQSGDRTLGGFQARPRQRPDPPNVFKRRLGRTFYHTFSPALFWLRGLYL